MNADIILSNFEVYGTPSGQLVRVRVGETIRISLGDIGDGPIDWATTKDPVLKVDDNGTEAVVVAEKVGASEVQIQRDRTVVHHITVEVFGTEAQGFKVPAPQTEPI